MECQFCGLPTSSLYWIYEIQVCYDCCELAEVAYEPEESAS